MKSEMRQTMKHKLLSLTPKGHRRFLFPPSALSLHPSERSESGQAIFELAIVAALLILMAAGAMWFGLMAYARLAADTASYDCATAASQSLDRNQGFAQGIIAAQETARGFRFAPEDVNIQVVQPDVWDRGQEVSCQVTIHIRSNGLPLVGLFGEPSPASARTALLIEKYKSYWK